MAKNKNSNQANHQNNTNQMESKTGGTGSQARNSAGNKKEASAQNGTKAKDCR